MERIVQRICRTRQQRGRVFQRLGDKAEDENRDSNDDLSSELLALKSEAEAMRE